MKIDHAEIKKRISVFALSLIIIHRIILLAAKGTPIASRTCVETEDNVYFCTDDLQEAREKSKKTHRYYLDNFGARQTIVGNSKDMEKMRIWESDMEVYLKKFIEERGDGEEWLKELCTNQHKNCIFWASKGECKSNPTYMEQNCSLACQSCHKLNQQHEGSCSCAAEQEFCNSES
mmetsp:Transcript_20975/g.41810  ORF Transcript_20975/g.41810 Transcript_20975/m.41810 type:complete len:176 (-) Transcript_20975:3565-4092(-)